MTAVYLKRLQCFCQRLRHRHTEGLAGFGVGCFDFEQAVSEIDMALSKRDQFRFPKARVQGSNCQRLELWIAMRQEPGFFLLC